jgi:hypothetical protein
MNGGSIVNNATALNMINAAGDMNGNCENTFYSFTFNGFPTINIAGFTNFITNTPTSPPYNCNMPTYYSNSSSPAPN